MTTRIAFLLIIVSLFAYDPLAGFAQAGSRSADRTTAFERRDYNVSINGNSIFIHIGAPDWLTQRGSARLSQIIIYAGKWMSENGRSGFWLELDFSGDVVSPDAVRLDADGEDIHFERASSGVVIGTRIHIGNSSVVLGLSQSDYHSIKHAKTLAIKVGGRCFLLSDANIRVLTSAHGLR